MPIVLRETIENILGVTGSVEVLGNSVAEYVGSAVVLVVLVGVFMLAQRLVLTRLYTLAKRTQTEFDDVIIDIVRGVRPPFYSFLAFYIAILPLSFPDIARTIVSALLLFWVVYLVIQEIQKVVDFVLRLRMADADERAQESAAKTLGAVIKGVVWLLGILFLLSNLGVNVTSVLAGIGIGGIAIAFALQNILGDLFSSFAIYFDKPFQPGDFIIVGEHMGVVERVGVKTTRIRALQGEEIVISNQELTSARVQNFKKMNERRIQFGFGVTYQTPTEKLEKIPDMVTEIFQTQRETRLDRVHFKEFGDSALVFEVVYYVLSPDYNGYMDIQQAVNLAMKRQFEGEGIEMAYPTQTIYIEKRGQ